MAVGYFTAVFKYEDFEVLKSDPIYARMFELMRAEDGPLRVTAMSHDDEMTRAEMFREAMEKYRDRDDLEDAFEEIENAASVHALRNSANT